MPVVTRTMRRSFEGQPPDFVSLKTAPLVSETKETVLKQRLAAIDTNIPISTTSQRLLAKANADIGKPLSSPTKSSRLPVPVLRERSSGQPCTPVKSGVGKSRRGLRGPIRKLPDTLLARIIDCLHADPDTLAACTLVHPSWTDRARHHLFASLTFGVFPQYDTPDVALGPLHTFSATATHNIRQLVLNFVEATHVPRLNISGLGRALAKLPNLDDLVLAGLTLWAGPVHEARAGPPQRVEELALDDMTLDPRELLQLLAVVAPRHKLSLGRDIKVRSKFWVDDVSPPALRVLEKVSWKELAMGFHEGRKYGVIMGALRKTRMPRRLETLAIDQLWAPDVPAIQEIFADVSATLRRLTLNLTECASTPESRLGLSSGFELYSLRRLEDLRLQFSNPHMAQELLGFILREIEVRPAAPKPKVNLVIHVAKQFIDQLDSWDEVLTAAKTTINSVDLRIYDEPSEDYWDDGKGRAPTIAEWKVIWGKMPLFVPPEYRLE